MKVFLSIVRLIVLEVTVVFGASYIESSIVISSFKLPTG